MPLFRYFQEMIIGAFNDEPNRDTEETDVTALGGGLVGITLFLIYSYLLSLKRSRKSIFTFQRINKGKSCLKVFAFSR